MPHFNSKRTALSAAIAATFSCGAWPALAQTAPTPDAPAPAIQTVAVTGFRAAAEDALNIKRNADGFLDAISADGLGRFPDLNVGEALARLPGVQIDRNAGDRDATISLRGMSGSFAKYTLNGMSMASSANAGAQPMGTLNSAVFSRFVVNKSPGASDAAGGLSGNIDLQMSGALVRKDGGEYTFSEEYNSLGKSKAPSLTLKYNKHITPDLAVYGTLVYKSEKFRRDSLNLGYSNPFQAATYADGAFNQLRYTNIAQFADYFQQPGLSGPAYISPGGVAQQVLNIIAKPVGQPGSTGAIGINQDVVGTGAKSKTGLSVLSNIAQYSREAKGSNKSTALGFEWKVNSSLKANVAYLGASRLLDEGTWYGISENLAVGSTRMTIDPDSVIITPDGNAYATAGTYENPQLNSSARYQYNQQRVGALISSLTYTNGDWRATSRLNLTKGSGNQDSIQTSLYFNQVGGSSTNLFPSNGVYGRVNSGGADFGNFVWTMTPGSPFTVPLAPLRLDSMNQNTPAQTALASGGGWQIRGTVPAGIAAGWVQLGGQNQQTNNRVNGLQQDLERDVSDVPYLNRIVKSIAGGVSYEQDKFRSAWYQITSYGANPEGINNTLVGGSYKNASTWFGGTISGYNTAWQAADLNAMVNGLKPTAASLVPGQQLTPVGLPVVLGPNGWVSDTNAPNQYTKNFTNDYVNKAAFLKANIETSLFGLPLRGNVGLRREGTDKVIRLIDRGEKTSVVLGTIVKTVENKPVEFKNSYAYNLPSAMLVLDLRQDLLLRAAAYKTFVRPNRADENPTSTAGYSLNADGTKYNIVIGKNNLQPYTANSYDLGLEWYNRRGSMFAVAAYKKDAQGWIYGYDRYNRPDLACPANGLFNGVDYGTGPLQYIATNPAGFECVGEPDPNNLDASGKPLSKYVTASGSLNSENKVAMQGLEFNMTQNLSFLPPGFWQNFGVSGNYTYTKMSGLLPTGAKIVLTNASPRTYNLVVFYEQAGFGARLIYNHRGEYVGGVAVPFNTMVKAREQFDGVVSYKFKNGMQMSLDMHNMTDAKVVQWREDQRLVRNVDYDGRTFVLSLRGGF